MSGPYETSRGRGGRSVYSMYVADARNVNREPRVRNGSDQDLVESRPGAGISGHWAREKIAALLDARRAGLLDDGVRAAVIEVALKHQLVSPYTSLVAVDVTPVRPGDAPLATHALATNLPDGWDHTAVFGLGQGATTAPTHIAIGLLALLAAGGLYGVRRWRAA